MEEEGVNVENLFCVKFFNFCFKYLRYYYEVVFKFSIYEGFKVRIMCLGLFSYKLID